MAMITRNEYGVVAVNNSVLCKMIIDRLLRLDDVLLPCSRKGRPIRKGFFTGFNDYANAVEIIEKNSRILLRIYVLVRPEDDVHAAAEKLFDGIEQDFALLSMDMPAEQILHVKGSINKQESAEETEIVRHHE